MRLTLKAINEELARRGRKALLAKGDGYFYFWSGEAAGWLDRTVRVATLNELSLAQWMAQFDELRKRNQQILAVRPKSTRGPAKRSKTS